MLKEAPSTNYFDKRTVRNLPHHHGLTVRFDDIPEDNLSDVEKAARDCLDAIANLLLGRSADNSKVSIDRGSGLDGSPFIAFNMDVSDDAALIVRDAFERPRMRTLVARLDYPTILIQHGDRPIFITLNWRDRFRALFSELPGLAIKPRGIVDKSIEGGVTEKIRAVIQGASTFSIPNGVGVVGPLNRVNHLLTAFGLGSVHLKGDTFTVSKS